MNNNNIYLSYSAYHNINIISLCISKGVSKSFHSFSFGNIICVQYTVLEF